MLENARRRIADQGRFDDGVARLYRTVEMLHQWRLKERGIATDKVDWSSVDAGARERFLSAEASRSCQESWDCTTPGYLTASWTAKTGRRLHTARPVAEAQPVHPGARVRAIGKSAAHGFLGYVDGMVEAPEARAGAEHVRLRGL